MIGPPSFFHSPPAARSRSNHRGTRWLKASRRWVVCSHHRAPRTRRPRTSRELSAPDGRSTAAEISSGESAADHRAASSRAAWISPRTSSARSRATDTCACAARERAGHPLWDQFHEAQRVAVVTSTRPDPRSRRGRERPLRATAPRRHAGRHDGRPLDRRRRFDGGRSRAGRRLAARSAHHRSTRVDIRGLCGRTCGWRTRRLRGPRDCGNGTRHRAARRSSSSAPSAATRGSGSRSSSPARDGCSRWRWSVTAPTRTVTRRSRRPGRRRTRWRVQRSAQVGQRLA